MPRLFDPFKLDYCHAVSRPARGPPTPRAGEIWLWREERKKHSSFLHADAATWVQCSTVDFSSIFVV
jgi:hypothetical protein